MADDSIASRVKSRAIRSMVFYKEVEQALHRVMTYLNSHPLFRHHKVLLQEHYPTKMGYGIELGLNEDTYVSLSFYRTTINYPINNANTREEYEERYSISAEIPSVYSSVGRGTGFFLFHLAMVVAILSGAVEIKIDNCTDKPERAIQGIYQLCEPDPRTDTMMSLRMMTQNQKNKLEERVHYVGKDSLQEIERVLVRKVGNEIEKEADAMDVDDDKKVWREDAVDTIRGLFRELSRGKQWIGGRAGKSGKSGMSKKSKKTRKNKSKKTVAYRLRRGQ